jgi:hypothetical protein
MARLVRIGARFRPSLKAHKITPGSEARRALASTMRALADAETLPGPGDELSLIPPTRSAYTRRVAGHNVWLWWTATDAELLLLFVTAIPPVPVG